ncbi:MAG: hypothetical protein OYH76_21405 [Defluviicoccus sp.]|nr:hypothetical protein [Defluviicoccus sp.]
MNAKLLAMNLIRHIGDRVSELGQPIDQLSGFGAQIDAPSEEIAYSLLEELTERKLVTVGNVVKAFEGSTFMNVNLSLDGWEEYDKERRGKFDGNYGFIAMKFGDERLDAFVRDVVKPAIKEKLGVDLVDLRDVEQAGIIDDIMRIKIRDAKFVISDLTHDNHGAYWEAGYAEGLGKPVVYMCNKEKFENDGTHFDVNHCTTIAWSTEDADEFCSRLIATLRRSLDL